MRSKLWHWEYFQTRPSSSPNENDFYGNNPPHRNAWCRACIAAYIEVTSQKDTEDLARGVVSNTRSPDELLLRALANVHPVSGRREGFEPHIRNCKRISPAAKSRLARERTRPRGRLSSRSSSTTHDGRTNRSSVHPARNLLSNGQQGVFESHLCKLWVANGLGWRAIDNPETLLFFQKWFPGATLPDSQKLSGSILQGELDATYSSIRDEISGRVVTGMTDGWKDVKRNPLMASTLSANGTTYTFKAHDISTKYKTVDNYLNFVLSDIDYAEKELNAQVIAWVSDVSSSSRSMRERLRRLRPNILTFDSWADQIDLVAGDILSQRSDLVDVADSAIGIIRWIFHHPHLLDRLNEEPVQGDKSFRALTLPTSARWISHFLSLRSLLFKSRKLRSLVASSPEAFRVGPGGPPEEIAGTTTVLSHIEDPVFWNRLMELALNLEPLAISANVSQASVTRLDHILVELGRLYHVFSNLGPDPKIRKTVLASLERLWAKANQGPYILAIFLNPFIRGELFSQGNTLINSSVLYGILERTFRRVFGREPDLELYEAFHYYYSYQDEFSPHRWHYRELQALAERERKPLDMVRIWTTLLGHQTPNSGRFQLVHLAIHIFSIVPNSDDRGRLFIHAKRQSRRIDQKELDAAVVRMNLKRKHTAEGETRPLKRLFGSSAVDPITSVAHQPDDFGEANTVINWADEDAVPTMRSLATQLYQDVVEDDDLEASDPTQISIPLRDLFDYTSSDWGQGRGLNIFKPDGLVNLEKEFERNALATQEMQKEFELENPTGQL